METNISAAKKLLEKYKSITFEEIQEKYNLLNEKFGSTIRGLEVMERITGFGNDKTCSLCLEAKKISNERDFCEYCIYKNENDKYFYCLSETYQNLSNARTIEKIFNALQKRIKFLEEIIEKFTE